MTRHLEKTAILLHETDQQGVLSFSKKPVWLHKNMAVCIYHYREISVPLSFNYFLLIIYRGWMSEKRRRMDKERGRTEKKASPTLSEEGPKACANPSGWSRNPFGMESGTRASGFLMQEN